MYALNTSVARQLAGAVTAIALAAGTLRAADPKFQPDDPKTVERDVRDASRVRRVDIDHAIGGWQAIHGVGTRANRRAMNVNSIDEVPDSSWFTERIGRGRMSIDAIVRGPDSLIGPLSGPWVVVAGKTNGVTPGLQLKDPAGRRFFVKFDPPGNPEMASGAEVIATKLLYALGYFVPENYIATLRRNEVTLAPDATFETADGARRPMTFGDVDRVLQRAARQADGSYRMLASLRLEGAPVGPFQYYGTRRDDPNDVVPHEHRRELRALRVFAAWLDHVDTKAENSLDVLMPCDGRTLVRHYLLDFGSTLGSAGTEPKDWRDGHEYAFEKRRALLSLLTVGAYTPPWMFIRYPNLPAVGRIEGDFFRPDQWKPTLPNPAFDNARPEDTFWAARRVMAFSEEAIRAVVAAAQFTDPAATLYLGDVLIRRRAEIGRTWLTGVNPIVDFAIDRNGTLTFQNAATDAGVAVRPRGYEVRWSLFDNVGGTLSELAPWTATNGTSSRLPGNLPSTAEHVVADVRAVDPLHKAWNIPVRAYFHSEPGGAWTLVGVDRLTAAKERP